MFEEATMKRGAERIDASLSLTTKTTMCTCSNPNGFILKSRDPQTQTQTWIHVKCGGIVTRPLVLK